MSKLFVVSVLLVAVTVISGCAMPHGYHGDSSYYGNQSSGYSSGRGGHSH